jgi:hypothetical protein
MRELRDVEVLGGDGNGRARIGGGALSGEVVHELWEEGKMAGECYLFGGLACTIVQRFAFLRLYARGLKS